MEVEEPLRQTLSPEEFRARRKDLMLAIGANTGRFLYVLVKAVSARLVLEIGTSVGYSTIGLAEAAQAVGGKVITIDNNPNKHTQAGENLAMAGLAG